MHIRLENILAELKSSSKTTAKHLSKMLSVSTRTVYRDVEKLVSDGYPIELSKGKNGGISYVNDQKPGESNQSKKWLEFVFDDSLVSKKIELLKNAIDSNKVISFDYINSSGISEKLNCDPYCVSLSAFGMHSPVIKAFSHRSGNCELFTISNIANLIILDADAEYQFSITDFPTLRTTEKHKKSVRIRAISQFSPIILDNFEDSELIKNFDGSYMLTFSCLESDDELINKFLMLGNKLSVVEPKEIKIAICERIRQALKNYLL